MSAYKNHLHDNRERVLTVKPLAARRERQTESTSSPLIGHNSFWNRLFPKRGGRVYAIAFDLDQEQLSIHYPGNTPTNVYEAVRRALEAYGFHRQQGSVYFGNETVTPVTCVMAVQGVQKRYSWFGKVVSDIRMLRIEEHNDLLPAIAELELELGDPVPTPAS
jgi:virulence-associated protein VapD